MKLASSRLTHSLRNLETVAHLAAWISRRQHGKLPEARVDVDRLSSHIDKFPRRLYLMISSSQTVLAMNGPVPSLTRPRAVPRVVAPSTT